MAKALNWQSKYNYQKTIWDLTQIIKAAENTEWSIRNKIIKYSSNADELQNLTLKEMLTLDIQYKVDDSKSTDKIIEEVSELLITGGWATQEAITALINNQSFQDIKLAIEKGNPYTNKNELAKALLNLSLVNKLGYDKVDIQMAGLERIDRDMTINLYARNKRIKKEIVIDKNSYVQLMDEVKSNTSNLYLGSSVVGAQWLYDTIKKGPHKVSQDRRKVQIYLYKEELVKLVNAMIYHKYNGVNNYIGPHGNTVASHFTSNVFISSPNDRNVVLLSEVFKDLQKDLNDHKPVEDYALSLVFQKNQKNQLQGSVYYGTMR